jgi:ribosomal protein S6
MRKYEIMFIVKPDIEEAKIKETAESMKSLFESMGATIQEAKEMGQKELAYEVKKYKNGYYFYFVVESSDSKATTEFDRVALINENIIRHLVVRTDER